MPPSAPRPRILLVEDDPENQLVVGMILSAEGYEVIGTEEGAQAHPLAAREQPNLILLDVMMPEVNGFEVLERLRADPATEQIPVVLLTALAQQKDVEQAIRSGVRDYLTKPFEPEELLRRMEAILRCGRQ